MFRQFYGSGETLSQLNMENGKVQGEGFYFRKDGTVIKKIIYRDNKRIDETAYSRSGEITKQVKEGKVIYDPSKGIDLR